MALVITSPPRAILCSQNHFSPRFCVNLFTLLQFYTPEWLSLSKNQQNWKISYQACQQIFETRKPEKILPS